ncbi:hypothetical protein KSP40_PGU014295 [Platanthera guangdongensis]|uniref:Uncharacterized protein n=1 Tax=Platanthera guangdongensis TaxID=2320717 RepID=A0ABR2MVM1_9ASPA
MESTLHDNIYSEIQICVIHPTLFCPQYCSPPSTLFRWVDLPPSTSRPATFPFHGNLPVRSSTLCQSRASHPHAARSSRRGVDLPPSTSRSTPLALTSLFHPNLAGLGLHPTATFPFHDNLPLLPSTSIFQRANIFYSICCPTANVSASAKCSPLDNCRSHNKCRPHDKCLPLDKCRTHDECCPHEVLLVEI